MARDRATKFIRAQGWTNGSWSLSREKRYIYDGMLVVQERNSANTPSVTYTRGNDLSGTLQGAGGWASQVLTVRCPEMDDRFAKLSGGMLARSQGYSSGSWTTHHFYHADGNGNITYLVNSSQTLGASYKYNPFGGTISSSGTYAGANRYRFSSKEVNISNGTYYYGYRWYHPNLQRWLNRDPILELGGMNLYNYVTNNPVTRLDPYGLSEESDPTLLLRTPYRCGRALFELLDGYLEMRKANVKGADKYFHCMAQCRASKHSPTTAAAVGYAREGFDIGFNVIRQKLPFWKQCEDSAEDNAANAKGRSCPTDKSCGEQCAGYLVRGL